MPDELRPTIYLAQIALIGSVAACSSPCFNIPLAPGDAPATSHSVYPNARNLNAYNVLRATAFSRLGYPIPLGMSCFRKAPQFASSESEEGCPCRDRFLARAQLGMEGTMLHKDGAELGQSTTAALGLTSRAEAANASDAVALDASYSLFDAHCHLQLGGNEKEIDALLKR